MSETVVDLYHMNVWDELVQRRIVTPFEYPHLRKDVKAWLHACENVRIDFQHQLVAIFRDPKDAILFKLRWG